MTQNGLQASANGLFKGAVFGRDSLLSHLFWMETRPTDRLFSEQILLSLARTIGRGFNPRLEEEKGKIAHEFRDSFSPGMSLKVYNDLKKKFGEYAPGKILIYPSVDATPLFVIAVYGHVAQWGAEILKKKVEHIADTEGRFFEEVLQDALVWIVEKIEASDLGLLEYARTNSAGHEFHVLEDGKTSYRHEDGQYPNLGDSIAYLTTQAQAHEALLYAELLFPEETKKREQWKSLRQKLHASTLRHFWVPEQQMFAAALDREPSTQKVRQVRMLSAVQPSILDSHFFDVMRREESRPYVESVLLKLFTPDFLTEVGVRSVALRHDKLTPYYAYQGSRSVWPVLTHRAARGCRRQGYHALAADLDARMLNGLQAAGSMREFFYVSPEGNVVYDPEGAYLEGGVEEIAATNYGEATQTWSIAAALAAKHALVEPPRYSRWQHELLGGPATPLWGEERLGRAFENRYRVRINLEQGKELEAELVKKISR